MKQIKTCMRKVFFISAKMNHILLTKEISGLKYIYFIENSMSFFVIQYSFTGYSLKKYDTVETTVLISMYNYSY